MVLYDASSSEYIESSFFQVITENQNYYTNFLNIFVYTIKIILLLERLRCKF